MSKYAELNTLRLNFLANNSNQISKVYQKKVIFFGDSSIIWSWRKPRVTRKRKTQRLKPPKEVLFRYATSFQRSRNNVYRILKCNVKGYKQKPTFWTFTFNPSLVGDIKNLKIANKYFSTFRKELNRRLGYNAKYLAVPEFQKNGNVHYHVVFFNLPFIETDIAVFDKNPALEKYKSLDFSMNDIWFFGFTDVILLKDIKNISAYISKYMSKAFSDKLGNKVCGEKLYFTSRGLNRPIESHNELAIDNYLKSDNLNISAVSTYYKIGLRILNINERKL